ncbi:MAG: hypothetical protein EOP61_16285 [Sphingomonadales bacterium]|nr:MAG: hypothetical protein EOP61_16285 [Sphingomonadales bacterium]
MLRLLLSATALFAAVPAAAQDGPEEAPAGHKWMNCGVDYLRGYDAGYVMGGPWLVKLPEGVPNDQLNAMGEQFASEYVARQMSSDLPGAKTRGPGRCAINQTLSDRRYYSKNAEKAPNYYHTSFKPSFAK